MKEKFCDLHTHSVFSDGSFTPTELIAEAQKTGLAAVALTDHNTMEGVEEFLRAAQGTEVEGIAGVEFSTDYQGKELHIVGLFIPPAYFENVKTWVAGLRRRKEESVQLLVERLGAAGYYVDYAALKGKTQGAVNRAHIAVELVKNGYVSSVKEAFEKLLSPDGEFYTQPRNLNVFDTIAFIKSIGGVAVWAHPFLSVDEQMAREFLSVAVHYGLDAMETEYASYNEETTGRAKRLAIEYGLLESGGSDFHGSIRPGVALGTGRGNLKIPYTFVEKLKTKGAGTR